MTRYPVHVGSIPAYQLREMDRINEPYRKERAMTKTRDELAELVCLMVGWTGSQSGERGKALHELWAEWSDVYEAAGGSLFPKDHPELSDERVRELAARRDETVARTMGRIRMLER